MADPVSTLDVPLLQERHEHLRARIVAAGGSTDRTTVLAVTKTFPIEVVNLAISAGFTALGENYGQELQTKAGELAETGAEAEWHFIGGLQRNKIKRLAGIVSVWQSVDRSSLVSEIAKRDPGGRIMIQVNATGEAQKSGTDPAETPGLVDDARQLGLDVVGLMTIGPTDGSDPRPAFQRLRLLAEDLEIGQLSMGMSGDLEAAVAEGSTMVRVGTALFGSRSNPIR